MKEVHRGALYSVIPKFYINQLDGDHSQSFVVDILVPDTCYGVMLSMDSQCRRVLDSPVQYLNMILKVAEMVEKVHHEKFVLGELKASSLFVDTTDSEIKVYPISLAQLNFVGSSDMSSTTHLDGPIGDNMTSLSKIKDDVYNHTNTEKDILDLGNLMMEVFHKIDSLDDVIIAHGVKDAHSTNMCRPKSCPDAVYQIIQKCFHEDPKQRPKLNEITRAIYLEIESLVQNSSFNLLTSKASVSFTSLNVGHISDAINPSKSFSSSSFSTDSTYSLHSRHIRHVINPSESPSSSSKSTDSANRRNTTKNIYRKKFFKKLKSPNNDTDTETTKKNVDYRPKGLLCLTQTQGSFNFVQPMAQIPAFPLPKNVHYNSFGEISGSEKKLCENISSVKMSNKSQNGSMAQIPASAEKKLCENISSVERTNQFQDGPMAQIKGSPLPKYDLYNSVGEASVSEKEPCLDMANKFQECPMVQIPTSPTIKYKIHDSVGEAPVSEKKLCENISRNDMTNQDGCMAKSVNDASMPFNSSKNYPTEKRQLQLNYDAQNLMNTEENQSNIKLNSNSSLNSLATQHVIPRQDDDLLDKSLCKTETSKDGTLEILYMYI